MKKYSNILSIYVLIKMILTSFIPYTCVFGIYIFPVSVSIAYGEEDGVFLQIAKILFMVSLLWVLFLIMNFFKIERVKRIARFGIIALSCIEILCLLSSIVFGFISYDLGLYLLDWEWLRLAAISVNIGCIIFCLKLNSKIKDSDK